MHGKANLQIAADTEGFDERVYPRIRALPGVEAAAPVVQTYVLARPGAASGGGVLPTGQRGAYTETLLVLGIDPFAEGPFQRFSTSDFGIRTRDDGRRTTDDRPQTAGESSVARRPSSVAPGPNSDTGRAALLAFMADPRGAAITRTLAGRHGLKPGSALTVLSAGRPVTLTVRHVIDSQELQQAMGGNVIVMDIAAAQELFHRYGKLDRIDLIVDPARREAVRAAIQPLLPPPAQVEQPQGRTKQVENMVRAFGLSLTALSFIALFVSMFLIFNTVSMAVLRRRREVGILRSVGVTRGGIVSLFLLEGLLLGVVGSLAGLLLGTLLARLTLGSVARTLSELYLVLHASSVRLDPTTYLLGFLLGAGMSLLSSLGPAIEASRTPPNVTVRQGILIEAQGLPIGRWTAAGFGCILLAAVVALWTLTARQPFLGFASAFLLLGGFSLLAPGFTLLCENALSPVMGAFGIEGVLGTRYLRDAVARTSVVVAALMVSVGMMVGLSIMIGSFRATVDVWVNQTLRGDLYVEPVGRRVTGSATVLPPEVVETARRTPGVAAVDTYRALRITYGDRIAFIVAVDFSVLEKFGHLQFMNGPSAAILARARTGEGVVITESFSYRHRVRAGDRVTLNTPSGTVRLPVAGVFYDYSTDAGAILMDQALFARLWRDPRTESLAIYVQPGQRADEVRRRFIQAVGNRIVLYVTPSQELRARVLTVFDQTFQITYALQAIAILVAVLGVISTLTALILQRGREIGVLRAAGALRRQVQKMVLVESALLGLIGSLLGCLCGIGLSILLIHVINKQFFGWSVQTTIQPLIFLQAVALVVGTSVLAGLGPARLAASRLAAEALRVD